MPFKYNINPSDTKLKKLEVAQTGTINDLVELMRKHQIALMVRPTGFGKTYCMIELARREGYKRVIYLYPLDVIKQSIYADYHTDSNKKFVDSLQEQSKYPDLPFIEFISYKKMIDDYNNPYRLINDTDWKQMNLSDKKRIKHEWDMLSQSEQDQIREAWITSKFENVDLLVIDEAHMVGAEGFLTYWPHIKKLITGGKKSSRLHILGATATPLRTLSDIDIIDEVFSYTFGNRKYPALVTEFSFEDCWRYGILKRPYYVKGFLSPESEQSKVYDSVSESISSKEQLESVEEHLGELFNSILPIETIFRHGVEHISPMTLENNDYMRFLVFYQNSKDLLDNHSLVIDAISKAFIELGYTNINSYYIVSKIESIIDEGLSLSGVDILSQIDSEISSDPSIGTHRIDIIHSIDMLNMGYHVGKVTGVIVKRSSSSEIIFYQKIGRCISVRSDEQPLIFDLANADGALLSSAFNNEREIAINHLKSFVSGCEQFTEQNNLVNQVYKYINMCLDTEPLSDELLEYWYFNRNAPIYYIYSISLALNKKETLTSLMKRLNKICVKHNRTLALDSYFCDISSKAYSARVKKIIEQEGKIKTNHSTSKTNKKKIK